ncbi:hypothetical protein OIU74_018373 [Salix koriyanagi]|uniref:DYW domain-containing protein n=1 Tax=Salix koriyanagi TaxID=2511006 RepID=A0A9Q0WS27_9ROSI|nr:hypothetical protein OIU74_018373 [Salix koriyanagi]
MSNSSNYYSSLLRLCCETRNLTQAKKLHCLIIKSLENPETFLYNNLINVYGKVGNITYARHVFDKIPQPNSFSWNTMLSAYSKSGNLSTMQEIFSTMPNRDGVSWNSLISGYVCYGSVVEAVKAYKLMMKDGVLNLNRITFSTMLLLVSSQGCVDLVGYGQNGFSEEAVRVFCDMQRNGIEPDDFTLGSVISSCANLASLEEGAQFHCQALVSGLISFITVSNALITLYGWATLLSSCRLYGNEEIGKWAAESLLELDPQNPAGYILLSSIYAAKGKWSDVAQLRRGMREKRARKEPGFSWIKYKSKVYIFSADDQSSPFSDQIYAELEKLNHKMIEAGYVPDSSSVLHDVEDSEKMKMLNHHSEKLAIAFGLLFIPHGLPIRVEYH